MVGSGILVHEEQLEILPEISSVTTASGKYSDVTSSLLTARADRTNQLVSVELSGILREPPRTDAPHNRINPHDYRWQQTVASIILAVTRKPSWPLSSCEGSQMKQ